MREMDSSGGRECAMHHENTRESLVSSGRKAPSDATQPSQSREGAWVGVVKENRRRGDLEETKATGRIGCPVESELACQGPLAIQAPDGSFRSAPRAFPLQNNITLIFLNHRIASFLVQFSLTVPVRPLGMHASSASQLPIRLSKSPSALLRWLIADIAGFPWLGSRLSPMAASPASLVPEAGSGSPHAAAATTRRRHRNPHRKSKGGCVNCRRRRVKVRAAPFRL